MQFSPPLAGAIQQLHRMMFDQEIKVQQVQGGKRTKNRADDLVPSPHPAKRIPQLTWKQAFYTGSLFHSAWPPHAIPSATDR